MGFGRARGVNPPAPYLKPLYRQMFFRSGAENARSRRRVQIRSQTLMDAIFEKAMTANTLDEIER
jgi:hypothetical protein